MSNSTITNDSSNNSQTDSGKSYETAVTELEHILTQLESNQLPLEDAIKQFESGVALIKYCQAILDTTEQKIQGLLQDNNNSGNGDMPV